MDEIEETKNKKNIDNTTKDNNEQIDVALFDNTLKEIKKTLESLGEKIDLDKPFLPSQEAKEKNINFDEEHEIDNTHIRMEELHDFSSEPNIKKKKVFGFYTYLALTIGIIFAIYELLNITKNIIIQNYSATEPYIEYFYEVIEILAYLVMNLVTFISNLF